MRSKSWRTRAAGAVAVVLAAGALVVSTGSPARAVDVAQDGPDNIVTPKPCPQPGYTDCYHITAATSRTTNVTQTSSGGKNTYEAAGTGSGTIQQTNTTGPNSVTCGIFNGSTSLAAVVDQVCGSFIQSSTSGTNTITTGAGGQTIQNIAATNCPADPIIGIITGPPPTCTITQNGLQGFVASQSSQSGTNAVTILQLTSQKATTNAFVSEAPDLRPVATAQESIQLVNVAQSSHTGNNTADIRVVKNQETYGRGSQTVAGLLGCLLAVLPPTGAACVPVVAQNQNTIPWEVPNISVSLSQSTCPTLPCTATNFAKVRTPDTKVAEATALVGEITPILGASNQNQGHYFAQGGNGAIDVNITETNNNTSSTASTVDVGAPGSAQTKGLVQSWTMRSFDALGQPTTQGPRRQIGNSIGLNVASAGTAPTVTSSQDATFVAPNNTYQEADLFALGGATSWIGQLRGVLQANEIVHRDVEISGPGANNGMNCVQNNPLTTSPFGCTLRTI